MSDQIGINLEVFNSNITTLKASVAGIDFSPSASLSKTDINPFKEYENSIHDLSTAITEYKSILENDAQQMTNIGKAIADADKRTKGN